MPELPEVEVVRAGVAAWVLKRDITNVEVFHPRAIRRHAAGQADFVARLLGHQFIAVRRRGKYLWLVTDDNTAVVTHLGMSGQLLMQPAAATDEKHLRVRFSFADDPQLRFVDQRTFGGCYLDELDDDVPVSLHHIAADPLEPAFVRATFLTRLSTKNTEIKRALLDQSLISGIGNIYADEALWRARLNYRRPAHSLSSSQAEHLLDEVIAVLAAALREGGTSFDSLYVNVNGESGYFSRSLRAYGREGLPCHRCGFLIVREAFMNRSSFLCPQCQPADFAAESSPTSGIPG